MTSKSLYSAEPRPRLCHLRRWPDFAGYGFNLHCEKAKPGQYIGKVDANSPAESAGLRENDRIIEVNFVPIGNENHKQVVTRIKEGVSRNNTKYPDEVILLVLDADADAYFKNKSIVVRSSDANVEKLETEIRHDTGRDRLLFMFRHFFIRMIEFRQCRKFATTIEFKSNEK
jgi:predicted metalloprotease with PDZ domain